MLPQVLDRLLVKLHAPGHRRYFCFEFCFSKQYLCCRRCWTGSSLCCTPAATASS
jgi:hypothetical protein